MGSFFLIQLMPSSINNVEVGYNDYRDYLQNGNIDKITYGQDDKIVFTLKDENDFKKYWTGLDESEKEDWIKYGAKIDIEPQRGIGLIDVILNIAPWLLIIFFWFYMTRRMQGGGGGQGGIFNFIKSKAKMISPEPLKQPLKMLLVVKKLKLNYKKLWNF